MRKIATIFIAILMATTIPMIMDTSANNPPEKPTITGPTDGQTGTTYTYTATATDPDGDKIFYCFDWGDGTTSGWLGPYNSGETATAKHTWTQKGNYVIRVKAKDSHGAESDWEELPVSMPLNKAFFIQELYQMLLYQILQKLLTH